MSVTYIVTRINECFQASRYECVFEYYFPYFSTKTYIVGTQKNHLNEMVLLGTQNIR